MAFLCTFIGILIGGIAWAALFLGMLESDSATLVRASDFVSPESVLGWVLFVALSGAATWLLYRLLRTRLARP